MPEIEIEIGGRTFEVACQEGEEHYLKFAAKMLDEEASVLASQIGRIPEARMLLMAGLMLADKTAGMQDKLREAEDKLQEKEAELEQLRNAQAEPQRVAVTKGYATAGWNTAPTVGKIVSRIGPILGVPPKLEDTAQFDAKVSATY